MRVGDDNGIYGESHDDPAWVGGIGATELENPGYGGRATDISNGLPGQGRPTELPGGGMPGTSGDEDGDAITLPAQACPGHRGNSEGGKYPPPTIHTMQHAGPLRALNCSHPATAQCARGADCKKWRLAEEDLRESSERAFEAYGETLENVTAFLYL